MMFRTMKRLRETVERTGEWDVVDVRNSPVGRGHLILVIRHRRAAGVTTQPCSTRDWDTVTGATPRPRRTHPTPEANGLIPVRNRLLRALYEGEKAGYPLTIREAGEASGVGSKGQIAYHYNWLLRHGYLTKISSRARSVRLTPRGKKAIAPLKGKTGVSDGHGEKG